jgi:hypothetical protein
MRHDWLLMERKCGVGIRDQGNTPAPQLEAVRRAVQLLGGSFKEKRYDYDYQQRPRGCSARTD